MPETIDLQERLETRLGDEHLSVRRFLSAHYERAPPPIYASADIRNAGWKAAPVDTNAFPAGFNNLCPANRANAVKTLRKHMTENHPNAQTILLLPEDHTRNPFYLQNVHYLSTILSDAGIAHAVGSADPQVVYEVQGTTTPEGHTLQYDLVTRRGDDICVGNDPVDLVISNNDFTTGVPAPLVDAKVPVVPHPEMGWDHRSKAKHFVLYNHLASQLADIIGMDPWAIQVATQEVRGLDFKKREGLEPLAAAVETMLGQTRAQYAKHGIDAEPKVFVKDDAGTYGMGITVASSPEDVLSLNSRARQKMDKGKYGHKVDHVVVQEAIPSIEKVDGHAAEPVFYMIGGRPIGAFMRIHPDKGDADNLNQPGMRFQPICRHRGCHDEGETEALDFCATNAEQMAAELASLALAYEALPAVRNAPDAASVPLPDVVKVA